MRGACYRLTAKRVWPKDITILKDLEEKECLELNKAKFIHIPKNIGGRKSISI